MALLSTTTGKENQVISSVEVNAYFCPPRREESPLFAAVKVQGDIIRTVGSYSGHQARNGIAAEVGGRWHKQGYDFNEGTIIKIWVRRKGNLRSAPEIGAVYLRMRENGPLQRLRIPLLGQTDSVLGDATYEGRFDLLTLKEVAKAGIIINADYAYQASRVQASKVIFAEILEQEREPVRVEVHAEVVQTVAGVKTFIHTAPERNLSL